MHSWAGGHDQRQQNFIRAWSVGQADFHRVEVAADVGGVDVRDGHVKTSSGATNFLGGSDNCLRSAKHFAHRVASGDMPECAVFDLAGRSDDCAFSVTFYLLGIATEC